MIFPKKERTLSFEKVFDICENKIHALFLFLSMLELVQARFMTIITGEGRNNFIIEFNENREEEIDISQQSMDDFRRDTGAKPEIDSENI